MPIGSSSPIRLGRPAERAQRRDAALLHRRRRERREADHVADGVDVLDRRAVVLVDLDLAALVGLDADRLEPERPRSRPGARPSTSTVSPAMRLPLSSMISAPLSWRSTASTVSPRRKITPRSRSESCSARTISASQNGSSSRRVSIDGDLGADARRTSRRTRCRSRRRRRRRATAGSWSRLRMPSESRIDSLVELDRRRAHRAAAGRDHDRSGVDDLRGGRPAP